MIKYLDPRKKTYIGDIDIHAIVAIILYEKYDGMLIRDSNNLVSNTFLSRLTINVSGSPTGYKIINGMYIESKRFDEIVLMFPKSSKKLKDEISYIKNKILCCEKELLLLAEMLKTAPDIEY